MCYCDAALQIQLWKWGTSFCGAVTAPCGIRATCVGQPRLSCTHRNICVFVLGKRTIELDFSSHLVWWRSLPAQCSIARHICIYNILIKARCGAIHLNGIRSLHFFRASNRPASMRLYFIAEVHENLITIQMKQYSHPGCVLMCCWAALVCACVELLLYMYRQTLLSLSLSFRQSSDCHSNVSHVFA